MALRGAQYLHFRDNMTIGRRGLAAWRGPTGFNLSAGDSAEYVKAMPVSKEFFQVFGVRPEYGDAFGDEHDRAGGPDAVVLSHGLWTRLFAANPSVVGSVVSLGDRSYTVLGVMPRAFQSMPPADLYIPLKPGTTGAGGGQNYSGRGPPEARGDRSNRQRRRRRRCINRRFPSCRAADWTRTAGPLTPYAFVPFQSSMTQGARARRCC